MFQSKLIKFCAPTLAGIKCGSLFKFKTQYTLYADELINRYNTIYNKDGIFFFNLFQRNNYSLIYVYRPKYLINHLCSIETQNFLKLYGYKLMIIQMICLIISNTDFNF